MQMHVKIYRGNDGDWILQVNCTPLSGQPYFFQKGEFITSQDAKVFFAENARMFALHLGAG